MVELRLLRAVRKTHSKLTTQDLRKADYGLFGDLLGGVLWNKTLEGRGVRGSWLIFKDHLLQAQRQCISTKRKSDKKARRPAWMKKKLLVKLNHKERSHRGWKQGWVAL